MDDLWLRFPDILSNVLGHLDNKSILNCMMVSKTWKRCIKREKILWHRREKEIVKNENALARTEIKKAWLAIEGNLEVSHIICDVLIYYIFSIY